MNYRTVSAKLPINEFTQILNYCEKSNISVSSLIRELLIEECDPYAPAQPGHVAGKNIIEYDKKNDFFIWSIQLDNGEKRTAIKNISPEYLEDLLKTISSSLNSRNELIGKKKKNSVAINKKLLRKRK